MARLPGPADRRPPAARRPSRAHLGQPQRPHETRDWLTIYYLPPYAPDLNPVEGIWSLLRRGWLSNVAFSTPEHLVQTVRRGLRHIQYRSHLIDGCLTETALTIRPA
ncbi:transposase [Saccharomonospora sp. NPDC046836]